VLFMKKVFKFIALAIVVSLVFMISGCITDKGSRSSYGGVPGTGRIRHIDDGRFEFYEMRLDGEEYNVENYRRAQNDSADWYEHIISVLSAQLPSEPTGTAKFFMDALSLSVQFARNLAQLPDEQLETLLELSLTVYADRFLIIEDGKIAEGLTDITSNFKPFTIGDNGRLVLELEWEDELIDPLQFLFLSMFQLSVVNQNTIAASSGSNAKEVIFGEDGSLASILRQIEEELDIELDLSEIENITQESTIVFKRV